MRQHEDELDTLDLRPVVVTFQASPLAEAYVLETNLEWPIVSDESLTLYSAYGMHHGRIWDVWGPATIWVYLRLMMRGKWPHAPAGNVHQLGGDVLIDPQGIVRLHHVGSGPADRPSVQSIFDVIRSESGLTS